MKTLKQIILQCDIFAHRSLQRYKEEQGYRTFAGGIISIIIISLFTIIFSNLIIQTFQKNIIVSQTSVSYDDDDPTYSQIITSPTHYHMFAIGISNVNLSDSQRYFDITMIKNFRQKNGTNSIKINQVIPMQPCTLRHWSGMGASIQSNFHNLNFKNWICPPLDTKIPLQGKFTSNIFKFAQIKVSKCTNNILFPNTTCQSDVQIQSFLQNHTQFTLNYYFVNTVINPNGKNFINNDKNFINYYLQDSNYFAFDTTLGVNANLFYTDYNVQTDTTFLPWQEYQETTGCLASETATGQNFQVGTKNQYLKLNLRKAADNILITRSFQKVDQTFSYIGGLFGTITLLLSFMHLYSKYSYELDLSDKLFKKNNGGSFGSQNFNFIVFIGYLLFNLFTKFSVILNWKTMKKYHQCRIQCQKQLNIDLFFKKIVHFQEIARIVLEDYQLKMLLMAPKPTIHEAKLNRKRYLIKNIIYYHLEQKAGDIHVEKDELKQRLKQFLRQQGNQNMRQVIEEQKQENSLKLIQEEIIHSYKKLKSDSSQYAYSNKKIIERINIKDMTESVFNFITTEMEHKIHNTNNREGDISSYCILPCSQPQLVEILPIKQPLQISQFSQIEYRENQTHKIQKSNHKVQDL